MSTSEPHAWPSTLAEFETAVASESTSVTPSLAHAPRLVDAVPEHLDPRLQRILARRRQGQIEPATADVGDDEVAVIARVTDLTRWEELSEVRIGSSIESPDSKTWTVTARIPVPRIETVRQQPFVLSLKAAQPLRPVLRETLTETMAVVGDLPADTRSGGGAGVVIGIVDYGCDFAHENFRTADGRTRLLCIWHQDGPLTPDSPAGYGKKHTRAEIDAALHAPNPYQALGYGPDTDRPGQPKGTHGTHVMDIAAGNGRGTGLPGIAPEAELIFVDLTRAPIPLSGPEVIGVSLGHSAQLLDAIQFIFEEAGDRPCVVNVSLGTNGGPHDGSTPVETFIDDIVRAAANRAVVIAAANSFDDGIHAAGQIQEGGTADLHWVLPAGNFTHDELEVWYAGMDQISVELIDPTGAAVLRVEPGSNGTLLQPSGEVGVHISNRLQDPNNGDNQIGVFMESGAPTGTWTVRLHGISISDGRFHAWIERDDNAQSHFAGPRDASHTLGSLSCGHHSLVVGSYDAHKPSRPLSWFSSAGPTRDGRRKPELSAPGHAVLAAHSRTKNGLVAKSGTSMAAPAVTGAVALVLAEARQRLISLSSDQIRDILVGSVNTDPPVSGGWDPRYGHGRLSVNQALQRLIGGGGNGNAQQVSPPPVPSLVMGPPRSGAEVRVFPPDVPFPPAE